MRCSSSSVSRRWVPRRTTGAGRSKVRRSTLLSGKTSSLSALCSVSNTARSASSSRRAPTRSPGSSTTRTSSSSSIRRTTGTVSGWNGLRRPTAFACWTSRLTTPARPSTLLRIRSCTEPLQTSSPRLYSRMRRWTVNAERCCRERSTGSASTRRFIPSTTCGPCRSRRGG